MPRFTSPSTHIDRFESDQDVLHFPEGGVFGRPEGADSPAAGVASDGSGAGALRLVQEVEQTLDSMQHQLDQLSHRLDQVFDHPDDDQWHPPAA